MKFNKGFSLIEVLVGLSIVMIATSAIGTFMYHSSLSISALQQKMEIQDLRQFMLTNFVGRAGICSCNFSVPGRTFDANAPKAQRIVTLDQLRNGCNAGPVIAQAGQRLPGGSQLEVAAIRVANLEPTGTSGVWQGNIQVNFNPATTRLALKGAEISHAFTVDNSNPGQTRIMACINEVGSGANQITEMSCSFTSNDIASWAAGVTVVNGCNPPACPADLTDMGSLGCKATGGVVNGYGVAKCSRLCSSTPNLAPGTLYKTSCAMRRQNFDGSPCANLPPMCAQGTLDMGINCNRDTQILSDAETINCDRLCKADTIMQSTAGL